MSESVSGDRLEKRGKTLYRESRLARPVPDSAFRTRSSTTSAPGSDLVREVIVLSLIAMADLGTTSSRGAGAASAASKRGEMQISATVRERATPILRDSILMMEGSVPRIKSCNPESLTSGCRIRHLRYLGSSSIYTHSRFP